MILRVTTLVFENMTHLAIVNQSDYMQLFF